MTRLFDYFRLIRLPNLIIVGLTQLLVAQQLFGRHYQNFGINPRIDAPELFLLIASTILITASGNIINDLFDQEADAVNKPRRQVLGKRISTRLATWVFLFGSLIAFFLSFYLCLSIEMLTHFFLFPGILLLLVGYSWQIKRLPLLGNLLVAVLCAAVPGIIWLLEWERFQLLATAAPELASQMSGFLIWYMAFAGLATLFRELIKDMEDVAGDALVGCRTFPLIYGLAATKYLALLLGGLLLALLSWEFLFFKSYFFRVPSLYFIIPGVFLPLIFSLYRLAIAKSKQHYHFISQMAKLILLNGVLLLLFIE